MKSRKRPVVIDLFAGAGGLSLGFEQAGFDVICAVEIDPIHALVHEYNFPNTKVIAKSVQDIDGNYIREVCNLKSDDVIDVLVGVAPCQGFSLIGHRAIDDPRNSLVKDYIRLIRELRPTHFLFENVKGLTIGKHKKFLEDVIDELMNCGYTIRLPWKVLNAKKKSVPQSRERLFLIGLNWVMISQVIRRHLTLLFLVKMHWTIYLMLKVLINCSKLTTLKPNT